MDILQVSNAMQTTIFQMDPITLLVVNILLVIATMSLAIITFYYYRQNNKRMKEQYHTIKEQFEITSLEIKNRLRPLLQLTYAESSLHESQSQNIRNVAFRATIRNTGSISARNIYIYYKETAADGLRSYVVETAHMTTTIEISALRPNDQHDFMITLPWPHEKSTSKLLLWFKYEYLKEKDELIMVIDVIPGSRSSPSLFAEGEDIRKAKEPLDGA
jgi:hypothetical protein